MHPPLVTVEGAQVNPEVFTRASATEPLVISTREGLEKAFTKAGVTAVTKQVSLEGQTVVVFAWKGSGRDRIETQIAESFPEQVTFVYSRGLTRDLRSHVKVYALRNNVKWTVQKGGARR